MLEKIEKYIQENVKPIVITYSNDLSITIKPSLTIQEERDFINEVLENAYTYDYLEDKEIYSPVSAEVAFDVALIKYFTDIPMISKIIKIGDEEKEIVDSEKMYEIYKALDFGRLRRDGCPDLFIMYMYELRDLVNEAIKFKNDTLISQSSIAHANEEAINSFGEVCNGLAKILETANTALEKNGDKLIYKITKSITKENLNKLLSMLPSDGKDLVEIISKNPVSKKINSR